MFKRDDWIFGLISLSLGGFVLLNIEELRTVRSMDPAGPIALPGILAWLMIAIGAVHIAASLYLKLQNRTPSEKTRKKEDRANIAPVCLITLSSIFFIFLLPYVGYLVAMPLLIASIMFIAGVRELKRLITTPLFVSGILFAMFFYGLRVNLPLGVFEKLF